MQFKPKRENGILFDASGNVVYRFAGFRTDEWHSIPEYIDAFHGIEYADTKRPGAANDRPVEARPDVDALPNPVRRGSGDPAARAKHDVTNPQADRFKNE